jgi:hypothetical protein
MRRTLAGLFLIAAIACGSDSTTTEPDVQMTGTWSLQSVNGAALPYLVQTTPSKVELLSDVFVMATGGFVEQSIVRTTTGTTVTLDTARDVGTYTVKGSATTFMWSSDGSSAVVSVTGNTFLAKSGSTSFVYSR